ncbi:hypothetical protein V8G54_009331 [Vigna mungo]|uniref:Uncharacterized protein n=1 Tax=Vigna mungo TaxID=3915 RepID=A0AAQ3NUL6_VIGMU
MVKQGNSNVNVIPCSLSSSSPTISSNFSHLSMLSVLSFSRLLARDEDKSVTKLLQPVTVTFSKLGKLTIPSIFSFHTHFKFDKFFKVSSFKLETIPFVLSSLSSKSNITLTASELCTFNFSKFFK